MSDETLSARQLKILVFIRDEIDSKGIGPTVREIVTHVGDKSPTSVHRHLRKLAQLGFIVRDVNKSRSIRLPEHDRAIQRKALDYLKQFHLDDFAEWLRREHIPDDAIARVLGD